MMINHLIKMMMLIFHYLLLEDLEMYYYQVMNVHLMNHLSLMMLVDLLNDHYYRLLYEIIREIVENLLLDQEVLVVIIQEECLNLIILILHLNIMMMELWYH